MLMNLKKYIISSKV